MLVKDAARLAATKVLEDHWSRYTFPVDPAQIALAMRLRVYRADLDFEISGYITKRTGSPAEIYLNANHSNLRQSFTCAHELGHYVERSDNHDEDFSFTDLRAGQKWTAHEFFANEFAGNLLMPAYKVDELSDRGFSLNGMADFFLVSRDAMRTRLEKLGVYAY